MVSKPNPEFGKRRPVQPKPPSPPVKRSSHVALLVMGTLAVGGGAFALMPREDCQPVPPSAPGVAAPAQPGGGCVNRGSSSGSGGHGGYWSSRSSFFSGGSSSGGGSSTSSSSSSVSRGGFGSFGHAFGGFGGE